MSLKKIFLLLPPILLVLSLPNCGKKLPFIKNEVVVPRPEHLDHDQEYDHPKKRTVTVFIHGSRFLGPLDERSHCPMGLHQVDTLPKGYYYHKLADALAEVDPIKFPRKDFYGFGWSGYVSFKRRRESGENLYQALERLAQHYEKEYGQRPEFRLICHSHGGNVALNLAHAKKGAKPLSIAETIIMACPVQHETCGLIKDPMFKKIYAMYSITDCAQILDPQGLYKTPLNPYRHFEFSKKRFDEEYPTFLQSRIKMNYRSPGHYDFRLSRFFKLLPAALEEMDRLKEEYGNEAESYEFIVSLIKESKMSKTTAKSLGVSK